MLKPSKVIRIDAQVWAELQRRARLWRTRPTRCCAAFSAYPRTAPGLHVLSRVSRCSRWCATWWPDARRGARTQRVCLPVFTGMVVADLRPQKERLRVEASKTVAETADSPPGTEVRVPKF